MTLLGKARLMRQVLQLFLGHGNHLPSGGPCALLPPSWYITKAQFKLKIMVYSRILMEKSYTSFESLHHEQRAAYPCFFC